MCPAKFNNQTLEPLDTGINSIPHVIFTKLPLHAKLGQILAWIGFCGRVWSIRFIPSGDDATKTAAVTFVDSRSAFRLMDRFEHECVYYGPGHRIIGRFDRAGQNMPIELHHSLTRILLLYGNEWDLVPVGLILEFLCHAKEGPLVHPDNILETIVWPHTLSACQQVWELHFTNISLATTAQVALGRHPVFGRTIRVEYAPDTCEDPRHQFYGPPRIFHGV